MSKLTTGRRKSSVARVKLTPGTGKHTINKKGLAQYFPTPTLQAAVKQPLALLEVADKYDLWATVKGGGLTGQAEAIRLGIARQLLVLDPEQRAFLKKAGLLTRDARVVERKKPGQPKARKHTQFSKR